MKTNTAQSMTPFWTLWSGQAISLFGSQLIQFALIWWLTQQTGSATILAVASLMGLLPQVILGPFIGVLVDRWSRRWVMFSADTAVAAASVLLAILFYSGLVQTWHVLAILLIRSIGNSFHGSSMMATTTLMVPTEHLTRIQGVNQMLMGGLNIIAAPISALLLTILSIEAILLTDTLTAAFAIIPLLFLTIPETTRQSEIPTSDPPSAWDDMKAGFRYVRTRHGILILMLMASTANFLLMPAVTMLPILVTDYFGGDALQFASTQSAVGVGIVLGGLLLGIWGGFKKRIHTVLFSFIGLGLAFSTVGLVPANAFIIAVISLLIVGLMASMLNGPVQAIMQLTIAPEYQGRVFSLLGSISTAMAPIGLILAGPIADLLGIRLWYVAGGLVCVLIGLIGFFIPAVINIEDSAEAETVTATAVPATS